MATRDALLDLSVLERLLRGDRQQMRKFADKFIHIATRDLQELAAAIEASDPAGLRHLGHRARSAALTVGANAMAGLYLQLEHLPADADLALSTARRLLAALRATFERTAECLGAGRI